MSPFVQFILIYYITVWAVICMYGLHRYWVVWTYIRDKGWKSAPKPDKNFQVLPKVTVQLPMFNERHVAERIIETCCKLDYPSELLQIQVVDDSTDESQLIAKRCCERMVEAGSDVQFIHRKNRHGFKGGALEDAMPSVTGEFIAVFDADFVPPKDFLKNTIHHFTDESIGMVQTRWSYLNRDQSLLTQVQAILLDGHFVIEQTARAARGRWFNFNGTGGIWRRKCIEDAGGWQHDTLTEDTDLSYRAQLAGWKFKYLQNVTCPGELPPTVSAFMSQQHRWNKGLMQTGIKLLPQIFRSKIPLATKIEAFFHLTSPVPYLAVLMLVLLALPGLYVALPVYEMQPTIALALGSVFLILGMIAACTFYVVSQCAQGFSFWRTLLRLPALMAIGVGVNVLNTKAAIEALIRYQSPFVRTPKYANEKESEPDPIIKNKRLAIPTGSIELALALMMIVCVMLSFTRPYLMIGLPFLILFAVGYISIGLPSLRSALIARRSIAPLLKA